ncbi:MAG: tRNA (adenosine(37)-N6)-threonylcarbamoyltransferase complex dimerization subunit type 1 TsaB [Bacteroidota bacterium]
MPLILNIDTATDDGSAALSDGATIIASKRSGSQREQASFLQPAIQQVMAEAGISLSHIDAVSVTIGPGSYTGLRVGLSSAKGLCYALGKPLIAVNTLQVMAFAAIETYVAGNIPATPTPLFCPMIDARRMEVFTALYDITCRQVLAPHALIIDEQMFASHLAEHPIIFCGDGAFKVQGISDNPNISVSDTRHGIQHLAALALEKFKLQDFEDIAYCEPFYLKAFHSTLNTRRS